MRSCRAALFLSLFGASAVAVSEQEPIIHPSTHSTRSLPNGFKISTYHPPSSYEVYERAIGPSLGKRTNESYPSVAMDWMKNRYGKETTWRSNFKWATSSHVYAKQHINGRPIANTLASVTLDRDGNLVASSSSFVKLGDSSGMQTTPKVSAQDATHIAMNTMNARYLGAEPELKYFAVDSGKVVLTHAIRLQLHDTGEIVDAHIDATTGAVVGMIQWTAHLSMRVVPLGKSDPRTGLDLIVNPEDSKASPHGWNSLAGNIMDATVGNNAWAFKADITTVLNANFSSEVEAALDGLLPAINKSAARESSSDIFDYTYDLNAPDRSETNRKAAIVNAWYVANSMHDILYKYGFTEECFNFELQSDGGTGGDPVYLSVQDELGVDNAFFATLEDGIPGIMALFFFNATVFGPQERDAAVINEVVAHEYGHGLSNRLTGGGTATCLQTNEARGLGEGWSDALANWVFQTHQSSRTVKDFIVATLLLPEGIRSHPYSTNRTVNPLTYASLAQLEEPHDTGEVWAQTLHIVYNVLVNTLGSADVDTILNDPGKENGHSVFMHLFVTSLATQPCNPTFLQARTAWIDADQLMYKGKNTCNIWLAFAYMGLGTDAHNFTDSRKVPAHCPLELQFFVDPPADLV